MVKMSLVNPCCHRLLQRCGSAEGNIPPPARPVQTALCRVRAAAAG